MVLAQLPLARTTVDADGAARARPDLLTELRRDDATRVVLVHRGLLGVAEDDGLSLLPVADVPDAAWTAEHVLYLGREGTARYVALVLPEHLGQERDCRRRTRRHRRAAREPRRRRPLRPPA
ncbi:hypothetical protein [Georgenia sp. 311]|uniref:hypothetical protein n=1 Tax=Georgenia sp. 311 TaxID=2585134 RepID=UPI0021001622|nr:hypothetical protein [Georgenia sp. 311]